MGIKFYRWNIISRIFVFFCWKETPNKRKPPGNENSISHHKIHATRERFWQHTDLLIEKYQLTLHFQSAASLYSIATHASSLCFFFRKWPNLLISVAKMSNCFLSSFFVDRQKLRCHCVAKHYKMPSLLSLLRVICSHSDKSIDENGLRVYEWIFFFLKGLWVNLKALCWFRAYSMLFSLYMNLSGTIDIFYTFSQVNI